MNVGELIDALGGFPHNTQVIVAKDAEGNDFSPLEDAEAVLYVAETPWSGDVYDAGDTEADSDAQPAICLWPVN